MSKRSKQPTPGTWLRWALVGVVLFVGLGLGLGIAGYIFPLVPSEELICRAFAERKNGQDAGAEELLAAPPGMPKGPVSREEAERLDAEFLLRRPFRVEKVRPLAKNAGRGKPAARQFVLVVKGGLASEPLLIQGSTQPSQRVLLNPDIIVEVRDGKIHGVRAQIHED